jgi:hypothetical protein
MRDKKDIKLVAQPTELEIRNQGEEHNPDKKCVRDIGRNRVALRPAGERPQALQRSAKKDAEAEFQNPATSEE